MDDDTITVTGGTAINPSIASLSAAQRNAVTTINIEGEITATEGMTSTFANFPNLTAINGIELINTAGVTDMLRMFSGSSSLTELDLSGWDTVNVTSMTSMFSGASSLTELDLSGWDTGNVTSMTSMFSGASSLTKLDLSGWDTENVTHMSEMFQDASSLEELDLSNWDTRAVASWGMVNMFFATHYLWKKFCKFLYRNG